MYSEDLILMLGNSLCRWMLSTKQKKLKTKRWGWMCQMKKWPEDMRPWWGQRGRNGLKKKDQRQCQLWRWNWRHKTHERKDILKAPRLKRVPEDVAQGCLVRAHFGTHSIGLSELLMLVICQEMHNYENMLFEEQMRDGCYTSFAKWYLSRMDF